MNSNAVISDLLYAPALLPQAGSNVPHWEDGIPEFQTFSRSVQFPSLPDTWLSVERGQTQLLPPGNYGNYSVKDGGVLELAPGRYYFRSLGAEPNSTLRVTGPAGGVFIYVKGDFTFRGVQAFAEPAQEMMVVSFAQQVTKRPFQGVVMAPEGTLALGGTTGQTFTGQFFGAFVEVRNGATIGLRPFAYGLWDDGDECGWGADEGAECEYDVACPGQGNRRCHETACACQVPSGTYLPADGCGSLETEVDGRTWIRQAAQGNACEPSYQCSGEGLCDPRGYCECTGALAGDGSECTEPSLFSSDVIRPVTDGTSCSGDATSTCTEALACAGGACACPDVIVPEPDGPHPVCVQAANSGLSGDAVCHAADCVGECDDELRCACLDDEPIRRGQPFRVGTQNVQALSSIANTASMFEECVKESWTGSGSTYYPDGRIGYHQAVHFEVFDDFDMSLGFDSFANKGLGHARVVSPTGLKYDVFFTHTQAHEEPLASALIDGAEGFINLTTPSQGLGGGALGWALDPAGSLINWGTEQDDTPNWEKHARSAAARKKQLTRANEIVDCVTALSGSYSVVLAGDLNINGDLSNPAGTSRPTSDETGEPAELWEDAVQTRNEWDEIFNWNGGTPVLSAAGLYDTWAYAMTPTACVPEREQDVPNEVEKCAVPGATRSSEPWTYQRGSAVYDRGFTWGADSDTKSGRAENTAEERLDYVLLGDGVASSPSGIPAPSRSQHTMRALNLKVEDAGKSAFAREQDGVKNGTLLMTDHIGVNAWVDEDADHMTPSEGYELTSEAFEAGDWVEVPMKLEYDTAVHWFKLATPGEYVFSANPLHNVPSEGPSADNGLKLQVYEATELSSPGYPIRGEVLEVPPRVVSQTIGTGEFRLTVDEWIPGVRQARFSPADFPIYIKVFAAEPDRIRAKQGNYIFRAKRVSCASEEEACNLLPWAVVLDKLEPPNPTSPEDTWTKLQGGEGWFKFNIERPDSALIGQGIEVFVVEPLPDNPDDTVIDNVALLDAETGAPVEDVEFVASTETYNGTDWKVWSYAESAYESTNERPLNDRAGSGPVVGRQYLLRVQKKTTAATNDPWTIMPGYTTTLTWMHGTPYSPSDCELDCKETQEVGDDEIHMALNVGGPGSLQTWIPDDMGLVGGGDKEAKDGVKFATIDEPRVEGWSNRFFERIELEHRVSATNAHGHGPFSEEECIDIPSGHRGGPASLLDHAGPDIIQLRRSSPPAHSRSA